jgi:hypothetical protein
MLTVIDEYTRECRAIDVAPAPFGVVLSLAGASRAERVAPEHFRGYAVVEVE